LGFGLSGHTENAASLVCLHAPSHHVERVHHVDRHQPLRPHHNTKIPNAIRIMGLQISCSCSSLSPSLRPHPAHIHTHIRNTDAPDHTQDTHAHTHTHTHARAHTHKCRQAGMRTRTQTHARARTHTHTFMRRTCRRARTDEANRARPCEGTQHLNPKPEPGLGHAKEPNT